MLRDENKNLMTGYPGYAQKPKSSSSSSPSSHNHHVKNMHLVSRFDLYITKWETVVVMLLKEFVGSYLLCLIINNAQANVLYQTSLSADPNWQTLRLGLSTALSAAVLHGTLESGLFNPMFWIYIYLKWLYCLRMNLKNALMGLALVALFIVAGLGGAALAGMSQYYQTQDYGKIGLPVVNPASSNNAIMFNMFLSELWVMLVIVFLFREQEDTNKVVRKVKTDDIPSPDDEVSTAADGTVTATTPFVPHAMQTAHYIADRTMRMYFCFFIGCAYFISTLYSFDISGGNVNFYPTAVNSWLSGNSYAVAQQLYGQLLATGAALLFGGITLFFEKRILWGQR
jgi:hypothetical protein